MCNFGPSECNLVKGVNWMYVDVYDVYACNFILKHLFC